MIFGLKTMWGSRCTKNVTPETMVRDKKGLRNHCVVSDMTSMSRYTYTDRGMSAK